MIFPPRDLLIKDTYFYALESPSNKLYVETSEWNGFFNWSMTYRLDSDFPILHGKLVSKTSDSQLTLDDPSIEHFGLLNAKRFTRGKKEFAAWFVSNCLTKSRRELLVNALRQHGIKVGGGDYASFLPKNSYIDATTSAKFVQNPRVLAKQLKELDRSDAKYAEYFWWKNRFSARVLTVEDHAERHCQLCERLHEDASTKVISDLEEWWERQPNADGLDSNKYLEKEGQMSIFMRREKSVMLAGSTSKRHGFGQKMCSWLLRELEEFSTLSEISESNDVEGCIRHLGFIERSKSDKEFSELQAHQRWTKFLGKIQKFNRHLLVKIESSEKDK
ncbi:FUT-1 [Lepeophtheirus salmonis]|uniref:Fucosyltransferase n=1 Tax=Lepeophtheirus salmonis TaxID=72036 RepID=A0A7R8H0H2_LEPSM|nr:FUT-1 [Lepeophtheirus salmonis]CAF2789831.1 FUT-1 [Lepeophtheirus salmonis]